MSDLVLNLKMSMHGLCLNDYNLDSAIWYIENEYMPCVNKISDLLPNLSTVYAKKDFGLVDKLRFGGYKFIRNPESFNNSMRQVSEAVWNVLTVCLSSMDDIQAATRATNDKWNSAKCKGKSVAMETKVSEIVDLIGEFLEACSSSKALTERDANILKIELKTSESQREKASRDEKEAREDFNMWKSRVNRAQGTINKTQSIKLDNVRKLLRHSKECHRPQRSGEFDSMIRYDSSIESRDELKAQAENVKMFICNIIDTITNSSLDKGYLIYDEIRGELRELHFAKDLLQNVLRDIYFGECRGTPYEVTCTKNLSGQITSICNSIDKIAVDLRNADKSELKRVVRSAHDLKCRAIELEIDVAYELADFPSGNATGVLEEESILDDGTLLDLYKTPKELKDYNIKLALDNYYTSNEEFEKRLSKLREAEEKRKEIELAIQTMSTVRQPEMDHQIVCLGRAVSMLQVLRLEFGKLRFIFHKCTLSLKNNLQGMNEFEEIENITPIPTC